MYRSSINRVCESSFRLYTTKSRSIIGFNNGSLKDKLIRPLMTFDPVSRIDLHKTTSLRDLSTGTVKPPACSISYIDEIAVKQKVEPRTLGSDDVNLVENPLLVSSVDGGAANGRYQLFKGDGVLVLSRPEYDERIELPVDAVHWLAYGLEQYCLMNSEVRSLEESPQRYFRLAQFEQQMIEVLIHPMAEDESSDRRKGLGSITLYNLTHLQFSSSPSYQFLTIDLSMWEKSQGSIQSLVTALQEAIG